MSVLIVIRYHLDGRVIRNTFDLLPCKRGLTYLVLADLEIVVVVVQLLQYWMVAFLESGCFDCQMVKQCQEQMLRQQMDLNQDLLIKYLILAKGLVHFVSCESLYK